MQHDQLATVRKLHGNDVVGTYSSLPKKISGAL